MHDKESDAYGRIAHLADKDGFLESLKELQVPCPWGDLTKGEGMVDYEGLPGFDMIPYVPIGLVVGCGPSPNSLAYQGLASTASFGKIIFSDTLPHQIMPKDYVPLDLTQPDSVNLFGYKVHAIMSIGAFREGYTSFQDRETESRTARALSDMLMPGGIIVNDGTGLTHDGFSRVIRNQLGYTTVKGDSYGTLMLQKPF